MTGREEYEALQEQQQYRMTELDALRHKIKHEIQTSYSDECWFDADNMDFIADEIIGLIPNFAPMLYSLWKSGFDFR